MPPKHSEVCRVSTANQPRIGSGDILEVWATWTSTARPGGSGSAQGGCDSYCKYCRLPHLIAKSRIWMASFLEYRQYHLLENPSTFWKTQDQFLRQCLHRDNMKRWKSMNFDHSMANAGTTSSGTPNFWYWSSFKDHGITEDGFPSFQISNPSIFW